MRKTKSSETVRHEIVTSILRKFPNASTHAISRIAHKENPSVFPNLEAARGTVRYIRGANGKLHRKAAADKSFFRQPPTDPDPFPKLPQGKTHFEDWGPLIVDRPVRALILSDLHIPYHEKEPIITAMRWGKKNDVDTIILNGDIADFFAVSFWEKDPRKRNFAEELKTVREFMAALRGHFPKARIIFKEGNHEERWTRYMFVKAPELLGIPEFEIPQLLDIQDADFVTEKRAIKLGDLNVLHGHEYRFMISNPVNPARGLFLRCKAYALCAHFHQSSYHSEKTVEQKKIATWSTGCLCNMHPDYAVYNNWSHGFAIVETDKDGKFEVQNKTISHGKVY